MKTRHITNIVIEHDQDTISVYVYRGQGTDDPIAHVYRPDLVSYGNFQARLKKLARRGSIRLNWFDFNPLSKIDVISFMPNSVWEDHVRNMDWS